MQSRGIEGKELRLKLNLTRPGHWMAGRNIGGNWGGRLGGRSQIKEVWCRRSQGRKFRIKGRNLSVEFWWKVKWWRLKNASEFKNRKWLVAVWRLILAANRSRKHDGGRALRSWQFKGWGRQKWRQYTFIEKKKIPTPPLLRNTGLTTQSLMLLWTPGSQQPSACAVPSGSKELETLRVPGKRGFETLTCRPGSDHGYRVLGFLFVLGLKKPSWGLKIVLDPPEGWLAGAFRGTATRFDHLHQCQIRRWGTEHR